MSWRVVIVTGRCKLEYKLGYLVCRGEEEKKVYISEISTLIIESTAVSITAALLNELNKQKVNVVLCDEKHNPHSQIITLYGRHNCSGILRKQLQWKENVKSNVWTQIVRMKIHQQYLFLKELDSTQAQLLAAYVEEMADGDVTNREGHAAKVYFNVLFGLSFKRGDSTFLNSALNYGYSVLLSAFNREVVGNGYNTQLGIAHKNEFNEFNLSCDLMEPFRVLIDRAIFFSENEELVSNYKHYLCDVLNRDVKLGGKMYSVTDAIRIYSKSIFNALEDGDIGLIKGYEF